MSQAPRIYRTFLPEVVSNTHDFDVRAVVLGGRRMRGVFARRRISAAECSLFMGLYPGRRMTSEANALKVAGYAARHGVDRLSAARKTVVYTLSLAQSDPGHVLDPTNADGELCPEFVPCIVCYVNEPPPGQVAKAAFVYNRPRQRYEVWLLQPADAGEELYLYYGPNYLRNYPIDSSACDDRLARYIPLESVFRPDPRGIPAPLQVPDWAEADG